MFSPTITKNRYNFTPMLTMLCHILEDFIVLGYFPIALPLVGVEMVKPSLSALFGSPKAYLIGAIIKRFSNLIPSSIVALFQYFHQIVILLLTPRLSFFSFDHIQILKLQKLWLLTKENYRQLIPEGFIINQLEIAKRLVFLLEVSITNNKPAKESPFVLKPTILIDFQFLGDFVPKQDELYFLHMF